jgi:sec-independent protein translocase protein TatC
MIKNHKSTLITHFNELKSRLIYVLLFFFVTFVFSYIYIEQIYGFLLAPLSQQWVSQEKHMIYTNLAEIFFSYLHLSYYVALFITLPFLLCQVYIFIAPGLYSNEKKAILPFLVISPILFFLGATFVYYVIFPLAWKFFLSFESQSLYGLPMYLEAKVSEYLNLTITMIIAFGLAFQLPVLLVLLAKVGIIDSKGLIRQRRFAVVSIFILAAILTPPDAITQVGLAIPMLILYELSIIACKKIEKEKKNA